MEQFEFHSPSIHPLTATPRVWKTLEPGISQMTLNSDPTTGRATYLQRWDPQTSNQIQNFVHDYIEEIVIVEGDLRDLKGRKSGTGEIVKGEEGEVWTKGAYAYRKPGMEHGPFRSEGGCLMFIVVVPV
jgi:ketosteroid isomerase-like protein